MNYLRQQQISKSNNKWNSNHVYHYNNKLKTQTTFYSLQQQIWIAAENLFHFSR